MFLKSRAEFWENPFNVGLRFGANGFGAKLMNADFCMGWHVAMVSTKK